MKFYLASSFSLVSLVQELADILRQEGHEITTEWWHTDFKQVVQKPDADWYEDERVLAISKRNFDGIERADALILVAGKTPKKFNGANIELGFALALGKMCYSVGALEKSAMYCPVRQFSTADELLSALDAIKMEGKQ